MNNSDAGIPYVTLEQLKWEKKAELREPRDAIVLKKEDDRNFVAQQMESVRSWMESTAVKEVGSDCSDMEPATLILEPSNSYLRAALYQHLEQEYGKSDFYIEHLVYTLHKNQCCRLLPTFSALHFVDDMCESSSTEHLI